MRYAIIGIAVLFLSMLMLGSCSTIDTGSVGVRSSFGQIEATEVQPGFYMKMPMVTSIQEMNTKETSVNLTDLKPKAADNLSLQDMDVSVYYEVSPDKVADLMIKYKGQAGQGDDGTWYPGSYLVERVSKTAVQDAVADMPSLTIHTKREQLSNTIHQNVQKLLDQNDPGVFRVTRIVIQAITTDSSIEASIQNAVKAQKALEVMSINEKRAEAQARINVVTAEGQAKANTVLTASLTPSFLQHERNLALQAAAGSPGAKTVILQANTTPLLTVGN